MESASVRTREEVRRSVHSVRPSDVLALLGALAAAIGVTALLFTQLLNVGLILGLGMGVAALALSIALAANANALLLLWGLMRRGHYRPAAGWGALAWRVALASAAMGGLMALAQRQIDWLALGQHEALRAGAMALVLAASAGLYFGLLGLLGLRRRNFMRQR